MRFTRKLVASSAAGLLAAGLLGTGPAAANTATDNSQDTTGSAPVVDSESSESPETGTYEQESPETTAEPRTDQRDASAQQQAEEYWTPERKANAQSAEVELDEQRAQQMTAPNQIAEMQQGEERIIEPQFGAPEPEETPHVGKVYFSTDAGDFECSANLVASANQSTLATAGHCLHDGPGSGFVDNFVFAPAYDDGESEEYGVWAAEELVTTPQWAQAADMNFDIGFAVLEEQQGQTIEEVLGTASPIAFNQDRNQQYTAYGYPYEFPYSGESLQSCSGTGQDDPYGGSTQGITCLLTEGSSGGPWFTEGNAGEVQVSVNSHKYEENPFRMYGPYFGDDAMAAYNAAANI